MNWPIVVLNFNRAAPLRTLLAWLMRLDGRGWIHVLDNSSNYPPTLRLYDEVERLGDAARVTIHRGRPNHADCAYPATLAFMREHFAGQRVVFTDPDLIPYANTPADVLTVMAATLDAYPNIIKVGTGIEIADVPAHYFNKAWLDFWERLQWTRRTPCGRGYFAGVGQTFAMLRDPEVLLKNSNDDGIRLDRPYVLKHVDWYEDPYHPSEEFAYYAGTARYHLTGASGIRLYRGWQKDPRKYERKMRAIVQSKDPMGAICREFLKND